MSNVKSHLAGRGFAGRVLYGFARALVAGFTRVYVRLRADGREHIPRSGAYIVAPVHRSYVDTGGVAVLTRRRLRFMGKDTLWQKRWKGWLISALGAFPVTRGTADREALRRCIEVLAGGEPLVLYPEGERKTGPVVQPLFDGAAYVAARAGVPIVPVGIAGTERVMPKGAKFLHPAKVHIVIGKPIVVPPSDSGVVSRAAVRKTTSELHTALQDLFDEAWRRLEARGVARPDGM